MPRVRSARRPRSSSSTASSSTPVARRSSRSSSSGTPSGARRARTSRAPPRARARPTRQRTTRSAGRSRARGRSTLCALGRARRRAAAALGRSGGCKRCVAAALSHALSFERHSADSLMPSRFTLRTAGTSRRRARRALDLRRRALDGVAPRRLGLARSRRRQRHPVPARRASRCGGALEGGEDGRGRWEGSERRQRRRDDHGCRGRRCRVRRLARSSSCRRREKQLASFGARLRTEGSY